MQYKITNAFTTDILNYNTLTTDILLKLELIIVV